MKSRNLSVARFVPFLFVFTVVFTSVTAFVTLTPAPYARAQAALPSAGVVTQNANQRSGPGTNYPVVGKAQAGTNVVVVETNPDGSWVHLDNGNWLAAFLVRLAGSTGTPDPVTVGSLVPSLPAGVFTTMVTTTTSVVTTMITTTSDMSYALETTTTNVVTTVVTTATGVTITVGTTAPGVAPVSSALPVSSAPPVAALPVAPAPVATVVVTGSVPAGAQTATVVAITDGDTIEVLIGDLRETVRYIGVDAPDQDQVGFAMAAAGNRQRVEGQTVYLVPDQSDRDQFNRLLRYVYLPDGVFVNAQLIADGWAQPASSSPNTSQTAGFERLAAEAAKARRGFWGGAAAGQDVAAYALTMAQTPLYGGPGANNGVDAMLPVDTPLTVLGRSQDGAWVRVRTPRRDEGWVFVPHLTVNVPLSSLAIASTVPSGPTPIPEPGQQLPPTSTITTPLPIPGQPVLPTPLPPGSLPPGTAGPTVIREANSRSGPGTAYPLVSAVPAGTVLFLTGRSADGAWYQISSGAWIAAGLVAGAQPGLPVVEAPAPPPPTPTPLSTPILVVPPGVTAPTPTLTPTPTITPLPPGALPPTATPLPPQPLVRIIALDRGNEWVILYNDGAAPQDLTGWVLLSETGDQKCPLQGSLGPRESLRVWAQAGPDGLSCGSAEPIWDNTGPDAAVLINANGQQVSRFE